MKTMLIAVAFVVIFTAPAAPGPATERLAACLVGETTGNDRVQLARWMGFAIFKHRSLAGSVQIDSREEEDSKVEAARIYDRLLLEACAVETRAAFKEERDTAFFKAFEKLGQVAANELFSDPAVSRAVDELTNHMDLERLGELIQ